MFNFYRNQRHSARKFQNDMKKLWEENSEAIVQLINHAVVEDETAQQWGIALANNQQKIANGIIYFCKEKKISTLFNELLQFIGESIDVFTFKKDAYKLRQRWYMKADELSNMLNSLSQWNVRGYFYKQILLIESLVKSFIKRNVEAIKFYREELIKNNTNLSVTFSNGIISDNAKIFF